MYIYVHIYIYIHVFFIFAHNTLAKVPARCHLSNNCCEFHSPPTAVPVTAPVMVPVAAAAVPPISAVGPAPMSVLWWTR